MSDGENNQLSSEDLAALNKDIAAAKQSLSSKETEDSIAKAKEQGRLEAEKELKYQQALEAEKSKALELEKKLQAKELEASEQLTALQKRVDALASSKGVISSNVPTQSSGLNSIDKMTEEQVNAIEENSARAFFGPAYDRYGNE